MKFLSRTRQQYLLIELSRSSNCRKYIFFDDNQSEMLNISFPLLWEYQNEAGAEVAKYCDVSNYEVKWKSIAINPRLHIAREKINATLRLFCARESRCYRLEKYFEVSEGTGGEDWFSLKFNRQSWIFFIISKNSFSSNGHSNLKPRVVYHFFRFVCIISFKKKRKTALDSRLWPWRPHLGYPFGTIKNNCGILVRIYGIFAMSNCYGQMNYVYFFIRITSTSVEICC